MHIYMFLYLYMVYPWLRGRSCPLRGNRILSIAHVADLYYFWNVTGAIMGRHHGSVLVFVRQGLLSVTTSRSARLLKASTGADVSTHYIIHEYHPSTNNTIHE